MDPSSESALRYDLGELRRQLARIAEDVGGMTRNASRIAEDVGEVRRKMDRAESKAASDREYRSALWGTLLPFFAGAGVTGIAWLASALE